MQRSALVHVVVRPGQRGQAGRNEGRPHRRRHRVFDRIASHLGHDHGQILPGDPVLPRSQPEPPEALREFRHVEALHRRFLHVLVGAVLVEVDERLGASADSGSVTDTAPGGRTGKGLEFAPRTRYDPSRPLAPPSRAVPRKPPRSLDGAGIA